MSFEKLSDFRRNRFSRRTIRCRPDVFETFTDLAEMKAGILAAKEHTNLPIFASMSFEANGRTFAGVPISAAALTLSGLGVSAVGINCSLGPEQILPLAAELAKWTNLPILIKPNAGLPIGTDQYEITPSVCRNYRSFLRIWEPFLSVDAAGRLRNLLRI